MDTAWERVRGGCMRAHRVLTVALAALLVGLAPQQSLGAGPDSGAQEGRAEPLNPDTREGRPEPLNPDTAIGLALRRIQRHPRDGNAYHQLGDAYIQKARATGDPAYYDRAEQAIQKSVELGFRHSAAWRRLAYVSLSRHQFEEARARAALALALDPDDADALGILGDAHLELGQYDEADRAYERMMQLDSSLGAYGRRSGLRGLRGDTRGAIGDLEMAIKAGQADGAPRENVAWAQWQLGVELFAAGDISRAETSHLAALGTLPGYHRALAGLAQVRAVQGRRGEAVDLYRKALAAMPAPEHAIALGDLLTAMGRREDAAKQYALVEQIARLSGAGDALYGRELAYFYLDHDLKVDEALALARREREVRRGIYAHDVVAWAVFKSGRLEEARGEMAKARRLGTRDPKLFFHAGLIHERLGDTPRARDFLARALALNPNFHVLKAPVAARTLEALDAR